MAKVSQCEQCEMYNKESGLCRELWILPEFNNVECLSFGLDKNDKKTMAEAETFKENLAETISSEEQLSVQPTDLRQRHGCATAWLYFTLIVCILIILIFVALLLTTNPNEEEITKYIAYIFNAGIMLTAVILLFKWNIWGLYIILCIAILNIIGAIFYDGNIGSSISPLVVMCVAFTKEAKDNNNFFDNLGLTSRRERVKKRLEAYYIKHLMRKKD